MEKDVITAPASTRLSQLLDDELAFSPSIQRVYSNHLAMALVALHQLGAPPAVLESAFEAHARGESELRDDHAALDERLAEVTRDGIAATVRARTPGLAAGAGTALFHPLIRLGYALDVDHPGQVAAALLDWETRHEIYAIPASEPGSRRLGDIAAALAAHPPGTWRKTFDFDAVAARPELHAALDGAALDEHTLDDLSSFAIAAHVTADDFVTLHLVTGARAVRTVVGRLDVDDAVALAAQSLPVMAVAYAAVGAPPLLDRHDLDAVRRTRLPSRDAIAERAVADTDPHVIKLANVALAEEERTSDPLYRYAAARVVGLAPPLASAV